MFNVGLGELLLVMAVALAFFGPGALPEIGRNLGRAVKKIREFAQEMRTNLADSGADFEEFHDTVEQIRNPIAAFARELVSDKPGARKYRPPVIAAESSVARGGNAVAGASGGADTSAAGGMDEVEAEYARLADDAESGARSESGNKGASAPGAPRRTVKKVDDYLGGSE